MKVANVYYRRPLDFTQDKVVLLFFEDFERDVFIRNDRHILRGLRKFRHMIGRSQKVSGFYMWFHLLRRALELRGYTVVVNDFALARRNPHYPVGIMGYPHILDGWSLPNPAVLGPGLLDHPSMKPDLMEDPRFRSYIVTCEWNRIMFEKFYGSCCAVWHAGIDLDAWPDGAATQKDIDILVYDKIRWERESYVPALLDPVLAELDRRQLAYRVIRYREYDHAHYRDLLLRSRSMLFLCEHETQGMAYQEAMACNVPILAWDNGYWLDPHRATYEPGPVPASSVPYFSPTCGDRFADVKEFSTVLDRFLARIDHYEPRRYVEEHLSLDNSADVYIEHYRNAASSGQASNVRPDGERHVVDSESVGR